MIMKKKKQVLFTLITLSLMALMSCTKNYYYDYDCHSNNSSNTGDKSYTIKFNALVNKISASTRTSSATALQANRYVTVYTFQGHGDEVAETDYKTVQSGILTPVDGDLSLPVGTYDFYSLSIGNQDTYAAKVTDLETGIMEDLSNGLDYLTCVMENEAISGPTTMDLTFNHEASQVMVIIVSGSTTTTVDSIYSATISQPNSSACILDLFTGFISPSTSLASTPIAMAITDSLCQQILLPLRYSGSLTMDFLAYINGGSTPMSYTVAIPLVNGNLASGSSYEYKVEVTEDKVSIATASVNPWTEVNETGTPLTPTPN